MEAFSVSIDVCLLVHLSVANLASAIKPLDILF
jgi:hypothetical protein